MNPSASFLAGRQVSGRPSAPPVSAGSSQPLGVVSPPTKGHPMRVWSSPGSPQESTRSPQLGAISRQAPFSSARSIGNDVFDGPVVDQRRRGTRVPGHHRSGGGVRVGEMHVLTSGLEKLRASLS